ncbi:putative porin, partial [uncultured Flavobacterium sp.]|uniref:putative porin n=1 Tax=uncultured Flavobacterium sp. TaxID=165435 RepID=UPI003455EB18
MLLSQERKKGKLNSPKGDTEKALQQSGDLKSSSDAPSASDTIATIDMYKIVTLERDTIIADTSLTIQNEYRNNYLRKDNFGLLPFPNDGHTYNVLDYGLSQFNPFPEFGFRAKHFAYMETQDINYYNVATPYTDLFYRSVQQQGQMLDAFITVNTSENLNMFIGYKGIRSIGRYINSISSNGNFRIGGSYNTTDKRYYLKLHFAGQDFSNQENGGIVDTELFESGEDPYTQRERLDVYFRDATSILKGNRIFADHTFRFSKTNPNSIVFHHRFTYETKFFEYTQPTPSNRFGASYTTSINNKTRYNMMYNMLGAAYTNEDIGMVEFYVEDFNYNYFYRTVI